MHGRIKTKSTEEQEAAKKQERAKKMEEYRRAMKKLTELRTSSCHNQGAIDLTSSILNGNPDILTVWNYRREMLLVMREHLDDDEFQKLLDKDMSLTEQCLRVNPKSYGSWHHRMWTLRNMPSPNWEKELLLCKRYLELDERNFHCWDYRRFLTRMANVPDTSEYEFTMEKIKSNFSNYSAWHLRSKLLPKIFPDNENNLPISMTKHKEELELVQNAAFTDPNDQSPWFYQRWLLGLTEPRIHFVSVKTSKDKIIVATSLGLCQNSGGNEGVFIRVNLEGDEITGTWESSSSKPYSTVWILNLESNIAEGCNITLHLEKNDSIIDTVNVKAFGVYQKEPHFVASCSTCLREILIDELSSCNQLLELEPESKWTILTSLQLMEYIDASLHVDDIANGLKKLIEIDPLRKGYYEDVSSRLSMEYEIRDYYSKHGDAISTGMNDSDNKLNLTTDSRFVISNRNLTCLYRMQYLLFLEDIDLSCNSLTSEALANLHCLLYCKRLNLDNNKIRTLKFLPILSSLTVLSVCNNYLESSPLDCLKAFANLKEIYV